MSQEVPPSPNEGLPVLTQYPQHLAQELRASPMPQRQKLHFVEAVDKVSHWGKAQPRVLALSSDFLILMTTQGGVSRMHSIPHIRKITHQRFHHRGTICVRILVCMPLEKDLLFIFSPRSCAGGDHEAASKRFLQFLRKIRERPGHRTGGGWSPWEGIVAAVEHEDLKEKAQLTAQPNSQYLPPKQLARRHAAAERRSQSAPAPPPPVAAATTTTTSTPTPTATSPKSKRKLSPLIVPATEEGGGGGGGRKDSPPSSPLAVSLLHLAAQQPGAQSPSHSNRMHEGSGIAETLGENSTLLSPASRIRARAVAHDTASLEDLGAPTGLASSKLVAELEMEIGKLKEDIQEKDTYILDLENHFVAIRSMNTWIEGQMYEKKGLIEDLEVRNTELQRDLQMLRKTQSPRDSPTSMDFRSRKVSFVEQASPVISYEADGSDPDSHGKHTTDEDAASLANASNRALQDEIGFLNSTVEELQRNRRSDDARVEELTLLVNRILAEKKSVVDENERLRRQVFSRDDSTHDDDDASLDDTQPSPRQGLRRMNTAIAVPTAVATQTTPRQTTPRQRGFKPSLPPLVTKDAMEISQSVESCGSSGTPASSVLPKVVPSPPLVELHGDPEMLRLKAYCDALITPKKEKVGTNTPSPRTPQTPPHTRSESPSPSKNTISTRNDDASHATFERFAQTETLLTSGVATQTELIRVVLHARSVFLSSREEKPPSLSSDLLLKLAKEQYREQHEDFPLVRELVQHAPPQHPGREEDTPTPDASVKSLSNAPKGERNGVSLEPHQRLQSLPTQQRFSPPLPAAIKESPVSPIVKSAWEGEVVSPQVGTCCSFHSAVSPLGTLGCDVESSFSGRSCPEESFYAKLLEIGMNHEEVETLLRLSVRKREHLHYVTYDELVASGLAVPLVRRLVTVFGLSHMLPARGRSVVCGGKSPPPSITKGIAKLNTLTAAIIDGTFTP